ncbi:nitroreductase family protein [Aureimonas altamirensis]|uniref:nitroreductase family protein n=1 Tax=Aureimonas altamirensis TaxID=370622 RepID=UPI001E34426A|nr:nitroreductase family protein [Aureimonas altamirensis]UHD46465.1 nitroreductase family protein [Aureimonas altamirensis]
MTVSRRLFLAGTTAAAASAPFAAVAQETGGAATVSLEEALRGRRSTRRFGTAAIPEEQLLRLLWAANGINREDSDGRTVPAWRSAKNVDIFVAHEGGVGRYDAAAGALEDVSAEDIRDVVSDQSYIVRAPAVLIYVSDRAPLAEAAGDSASDETAMAVGAHVNSAMMAQNVYLFAAAEGLGTVLIGGSADRAAIAEALSLSKDQSVTYIQPVGTPR